VATCSLEDDRRRAERFMQGPRPSLRGQPITMSRRHFRWRTAVRIPRAALHQTNIPKELDMKIKTKVRAGNQRCDVIVWA
jgi:hypothetical protein